MHGLRQLFSALCIGALLLAPATPARAAQDGPRPGDVIRTWNEIAYSLPFGNAVQLSRILAIVHVAQHDAVNGVEPRYERYVSRFSDPGADAEAAAAAAAHTALTYLYPDRLAELDAALAESIAHIPDGAAKDAGLRLGNAVGRIVYDARVSDGFSVPATFAPAPGPGVWQPTPPAQAPMVEPQFQNVRPFTLKERAAAEVLRQFTGTDEMPFCMVSTTSTPAGTQRCWRSFTAAELENAESRVLVGIHFRFAIENGGEVGRKIGDFAIANALRPLSAE